MPLNSDIGSPYHETLNEYEQLLKKNRTITRMTS